MKTIDAWNVNGWFHLVRCWWWLIANEIVDAEPTPDLHVGLIGYRDRGDTYITKHFPLTDDIDAIYADLLNFQAAGGGDGPESVNQGLYEAVTKMINKRSYIDQLLNSVFQTQEISFVNQFWMFLFQKI